MDIQKIYKANTKKIGKQIEFQEEITSTHMVAKEMANSNGNNGKMIIAETQTQGIGTKGRTWYTGKENNIAMTILLYPKCEIQNLQGITKTIAISMKKAIKQLYNIDIIIKPPNDLLLNNKKICGILTEINTIGKKINYLLISVGFNVNETRFSMETEEIATSLKKEYNKDFEREKIIVEFIEILENKLETKIGL